MGQLTPFAAYSFRVAAYNEIGLGEYSEPSPSYNTRPGPPGEILLFFKGLINLS